MRAVVEISGKQYQVEDGRYLEVDKLPQDVSETLQLDKVCLVDTGNDVLVGQPYVSGASVTAKVLHHYKGSKILVYKMRCKKGYRRKNGHRQQYTRLMIESIIAS